LQGSFIPYISLKIKERFIRVGREWDGFGGAGRKESRSTPSQTLQSLPKPFHFQQKAPLILD